MIKSPEFKVGQCLRLRKYVIAAFQGARTMAYNDGALMRKALGIKEYDPNAPKYVYLRITKKEGNKIFGIDLINVYERAFERGGTGRFVEFDPSRERKILDFWGYDEVTLLGKEDVRDVLKGQRKKLRKIAAMADKDAREYAAAMRKITSSL